ncbi:hypothetical protein LTSEURB_6347 [Salmonella enterica subsp. enterica serovar Urbana str. R8-2977]|uniref:Uncharacterized protein n=1 Tax=Salmonella enterica subsp. enterica serovar Urbana str. R8-2977 TaxID=913084 RepID=G5S4G4_SALET|nr:hypothetical protein LTSEURB_6347 [Salmonella enterica subsp. enterica serovar Urbana str. R8-2977]
MSKPLDLNQLAQNIKQWGLELGFQQVGITDNDYGWTRVAKVLLIPTCAHPNLRCRRGWTNNTTARWHGWRLLQ